jgi:hypothetical protein
VAGLGSGAPHPVRPDNPAHTLLTDFTQIGVILQQLPQQFLALTS